MLPLIVTFYLKRTKKSTDFLQKDANISNIKKAVILKGIFFEKVPKLKFLA